MKKILMIDDDKVSLSTAKGVLSDEYKMIAVTDGMQGLKFLENNDCDLILLDINMPEINGFEVYDKIKQLDKKSEIPVIFLTSDNDADTETRCLEAGAMDFISKPFVPSVIRSRVNKTIELEEYRSLLMNKLDEKTQEVDAIKTKSYTDALTGLWNREYTSKKVNELLQSGHLGCLFMIDLDNFKGINDNYGHQEGDKVLIILAETLKENSNDKDIVCRIGGDEFVVFFADRTNRAEISNLANDIIYSLSVKIKACNYTVNTSVSVGISIAGIDGMDFDKLYNCGDKALYYIKNNGKNSFRFYSDNVKEEQNRAQSKVDLSHLSDMLSRSDSGNGAYIVDFDKFHYIYNFVKRLVERTDKSVVSVLFDIVPDNSVISNEAEDIEKSLEMLEKTICKSLRRVDIYTRYSSNQIILVLVSTEEKYGDMIVGRILDNYQKMNPDNNVLISYSLIEIKSSRK